MDGVATDTGVALAGLGVTGVVFAFVNGRVEFVGEDRLRSSRCLAYCLESTSMAF